MKRLARRASAVVGLVLFAATQTGPNTYGSPEYSAPRAALEQRAIPTLDLPLAFETLFSVVRSHPLGLLHTLHQPPGPETDVIEISGLIVLVGLVLGLVIALLARRAFGHLRAELRDRTSALERAMEAQHAAEYDRAPRLARDQLFQAVVESSDDAIFTKTLDGVITSWNRGAERLYGYLAREAIGQSVDLIVPEDRRAEIRLILDRIGQGERVDPFETIRAHKDGRVLDVFIRVSPLRAPNGDIVGASVIARDIAERKRSEQQLLYQTILLQNIPDAIIATDMDFRITSWNPGAEALYGWRADEVIGRSTTALLRTENSDSSVDEARQILLAEGAWKGEVTQYRRDGAPIAIMAAVALVHGHDGAAIGAVTVNRDITERKRADALLAEQTRELERSNAELEQFAYVASHDLQEPLRMVASYVELLSERYQGRLDERADKYIAYAVDGARRMQRLINDLLAFSRVGTQGRPLQPTDAAVVVGRVLAGMRSTLEESGVEVVCDDLPKVAADATQLGQVFQNLISNAVKFHGAQPPRVRIGARQRGDEWVFSVADNGIGIEPQYFERIFQIFQRLHERNQYPGSGIGLAIVKRIVERHGGRIWVESTPGAGATFSFTLPAQQESKESADAQAHSRSVNRG